MHHAVSIHIGVNEPGAASAHDVRVRLPDSEAAAWRMAELASQAGYHSMLVLRGRTATLATVEAALWNASQLLGEGDALLVTFSGHGGQVPDQNGEERCGADESWSLHDGELLDDTLSGYWRLFKPGVRIVVVSESCFSGGIIRTGDDHAAPPAAPDRPRVMRGGGYRGPEPDWAAASVAQAIASCIAAPPRDCDDIRASVLLLTASSEHQPAQGGLFTESLLDVWSNGAFHGTYCEFYKEVKSRVMRIKCDQEPQILMLGAADLDFPELPAFRVTPGGGGSRWRGGYR